ncbi:DNA polymerase III subunit gamma/tau, partial [Campylobacter coli]|nr:DNA polymerase III subunit gamma/tau [Campylobacter coli]
MLQALAIKYRPKTFDELIGQKTVSVSLKYALNHNRLAHAYLFSGLRGSGKTSSARIFSRALVCEQGPSDTPCGTCKHCLAALEGKHIDIIEMDAASNRGLEDIQALIEQTKYTPSMARFKIFIIDEVHMLTPQAANALLKTLEEPPSYVKFILATTDPLKLPATVLSRTQHFRFKQIPQSEILNHLKEILLKENVKFEEEALKFIARSGNGSLRDTLTLLDQAIIFCQNEISISKITDMLGFLDPQKIKAFYQAILTKDKEKVFAYLEELQDYEASSVIDEMLFYLKESFFAKSTEFSTLIYERFFRILSKAKNMLCDDDGFTLCV